MAKRLAVIDLDGVIADDRHRVQHALDRDWGAYFGMMDRDAVWPEGRQLYDACRLLKLDIAFLTGRREDTRKVTKLWLKQHGFDHKLPLIMRPLDDRRVLAELKAAYVGMLVRLQAFKDIVVYDDDPQVIAHVKRVPGATARHCTWYIKPEPLVRRARA